MSTGTYVLLCELEDETSVSLTFGAAGTRTLQPGWYAYVGSALGPGGFSRIDRHRQIANGCRDVRHWHIDYFLGHDAVNLAEAVRLPGHSCECQLAQLLDGGMVPGIGASDCSCKSHLNAIATPAVVTEAVEQIP